MTNKERAEFKQTLSAIFALGFLFMTVFSAGFISGYFVKELYRAKLWADELPNPNLLNIGRASIARRSYLGSN